MKFILATALLLLAIYAGFSMREQLSFGSGVLNRSCTVTHATATLGHQAATTILSAYSNRAYAIIEQPKNASNTVSISFGGTATAGSGYALFATSSTPSFGLNETFAFTGAVSAITDTGSTTILVTECRF